MYLLKFTPILKSTLWGGARIPAYKGTETRQRQLGESWELSGVRGSESVAANGPWAGTALPELIAREKEALVGRSIYARFGAEFPLLVKFIDARQDLSIQVHPNDALALRRHGSRGKTEMWYVVDTDPGARLQVGFARPMTPLKYDACVRDHTLPQTLQQYRIHPGDAFFIPAGCPHSIGAGSFLVEIQQTSDLTYRIYDFDRRGPDGKPRELHTELAREAIDYSALSDYRARYTVQPNREVQLAACPYFTVSLYELDQPLTCPLQTLDSFLTVVCIAGTAVLTADDGTPLPIKQGETVLVPAAMQSLHIRPTPAVKLLTSCIR